MQAELTKIYAENKFRKQINTDFASMLIRLTITKSSQKAHPYVKVFRAASDDKTSAEDFVDWFESRGGIERIRLSKTPVSTKPTEAQTLKVRNVGIQHLRNAKSVATVKFANSVNFGSEFVLLVASQNGNTIDVVEVLDHKNGATKAYLTRLGTELSK